jgi:hypothetical protein
MPDTSAAFWPGGIGIDVHGSCAIALNDHRLAVHSMTKAQWQRALPDESSDEVLFMRTPGSAAAAGSPDNVSRARVRPFAATATTPPSLRHCDRRGQ